LTQQSDAGLTGAAFELAQAGYTVMAGPDKKNEDEAIGSDVASLRAAAEQLNNAPREVIERQYIDPDGEPAAPTEAITLERAARDYAAATSAERLLAENQSGEKLAARVDALRAEALAKDPEAAEFYGFEPLEKKADASKPRAEASVGPQAESSDAVITEGLDPQLAKALQHPQVVQAIEERIGEAEKTRQNYLNGLMAAQQVAQMSILSQVPELIGLPPENVQAAFAEMARRDPARFSRVQTLIANTQQMFAQQQQEGRRQAEMKRQNFNAFAKSEDTRLEAMLKSEPKETQRAVTAEIFASAKASGVQPAEMVRLLNTEPLMRNAVFQRMMYDAAKYRLMTKTKSAATAKALPSVQRPGMARSSAERNHADLRTLSAKLSSSGDIKDAVALYNARKSSRR